MKRIGSAVFAALCALAACGQGTVDASVQAALTTAVKISVDPAVDPVKDLRQLKAGAGFGFNANTRMYDADVARSFARRDRGADRRARNGAALQRPPR